MDHVYYNVTTATGKLLLFRASLSPLHENFDKSKTNLQKEIKIKLYFILELS